MAYSILIKNGTVIDGTGEPARKADVAITGNHISDIGNLERATAAKIIDATGKYISPGFIDLTSHSDTYGTIFSNPAQESMLAQGVTTALFGNCGESLAPIVKKDSMEGLDRWLAEAQINTDWNSTAEYYDALSELRPGLNVATLIGQNALQRSVNNTDEMALLLEAAMQGGAWGLSSNFSFTTEGQYLSAETLKLLEIVKSSDGLYKIHLQDEGKNFLPSLVSVVDFARRSRVRTVVSHFKVLGKGAWKDFAKAIKIISTAREDGVEIYFDFFPYASAGSMLLNILPAWAREGDDETVLKRLFDKNTSEQIIASLQQQTLHPERILIVSAKNDKKIVGKTLTDIASHVSMSPEAVIIEILKINDLNITFLGKTISPKNIIFAARYKESMLASDGAGYDLDFKKLGDLVHPRSFGAFPRFWNKIAPKAGLSHEEAIHKMTQLPAKILGLTDRGLIRKNFLADIAVFDTEGFRDRATYKNPFRFAEGLRYVLVNGQLAKADDGALGVRFARNGTVLRKKA
ncbi:MAG: amidohydrolase family protein [bacterium]|nr:amidohydrolase family protein [bacterium]